MRYARLPPLSSRIEWIDLQSILYRMDNTATTTEASPTLNLLEILLQLPTFHRLHKFHRRIFITDAITDTVLRLCARVKSSRERKLLAGAWAMNRFTTRL